jgi:hypothetical protein
MLLVWTGGQPIVPLESLAKMRNIEPRTLLNSIYNKTSPIPMFRDGKRWYAHVTDVATWIDQMREAAQKETPSV